MSGDEPELHRLHPLSPILRSGRIIIAVVAAISVRAVYTLGARNALVAIAALVILALAVAWTSWRFTGYRVQGRTLHVSEGVLFRRSRHVPLERVQAIDVVRPLLARVLGLSELRIEVIGSGKSEAPLSYLSDAQAQQLRARLLALAAGVDENEPAPQETVLAQVSTRDLVVSLLLLVPVAVLLPLFVVAVIVLGTINVTVLIASLTALASTALGVARLAANRLLGEYGFTVAQSPDGLRLRHGLLQTRAQTVPPGRVQAIRMVSPLLWRRRDWVRVEVDVAGYHGSAEEQRSTGALLPAAPRRVALEVIHRVLPGLDLDRTELAGVPPRARWLAPLGWRRLAVGRHQGMVVVRSGRFRHTVEFTPLARAQSIRQVQGPIQRALGLATVHVDTAGRHIAISAPHRDADEASTLRNELVLAAREERERRRVRPAASPAPYAPAADGSADYAGDVGK